MRTTTQHGIEEVLTVAEGWGQVFDGRIFILNCLWLFCVGIGEGRSEIIELLRTAHKNNHLSPQILLERRKIYQPSSSPFL